MKRNNGRDVEQVGKLQEKSAQQIRNKIDALRSNTHLRTNCRVATVLLLTEKKGISKMEYKQAETET